MQQLKKYARALAPYAARREDRGGACFDDRAFSKNPLERSETERLGTRANWLQGIRRTPAAMSARSGNKRRAMLAGFLLAGLGATGISTPASADGPDRRSSGAIIAEGVAQIVRDHEEADWQDLAVALHLPELTRAPATWSGPFASAVDPRFTASYSPLTSSLGITRIEVEWALNPSLDANGRPTLSRMLTVELRAEACPTPAEMTAATGAPEQHATYPGPDGGPEQESYWFDLKDSRGKNASIQYATKPDCELTAFDVDQL